jgi:hypothetical protein
MRKMLIAMAISGLAGSALAQQAPIPDWLRGMAHSDYGCEVLLCLANPNGPKAASACVPPINRLFRDLARGRGFPTCNLANGPGGRSYANYTSRPYDACPAGTSELPVGQYAELAAPVSAPPAPNRSGSPSMYAAAGVGLTYAGIGDGSGYGYGSWDSPAPAKVCVAGFRGNRSYWSGDSGYDVGVYDTIYVMNAAAGAAADVYIDDSLWQTVRW